MQHKLAWLAIGLPYSALAVIWPWLCFAVIYDANKPIARPIVRLVRIFVRESSIT